MKENCESRESARIGFRVYGTFTPIRTIRSFPLTRPQRGQETARSTMEKISRKPLSCCWCSRLDWPSSGFSIAYSWG